MLLTRGERKQRGARKSNPAEIHEVSPSPAMPQTGF
jgi:hypothetical protein